jgi:hypothetical protein
VIRPVVARIIQVTRILQVTGYYKCHGTNPAFHWTLGPRWLCNHRWTLHLLAPTSVPLDSALLYKYSPSPSIARYDNSYCGLCCSLIFAEAEMWLGGLSYELAHHPRGHGNSSPPTGTGVELCGHKHIVRNAHFMRSAVAARQRMPPTAAVPIQNAIACA